MHLITTVFDNTFVINNKTQNPEKINKTDFTGPYYC